MGKSFFESTSNFAEGLKLLSRTQILEVFDTLELLVQQPLEASLRRHPLSKNPIQIQSLTVSANLRIIIRERPNGGFLLLDVGDHTRVYKDSK